MNIKRERDYRKIKKIFLKSDILKKYLPQENDLIESKNTPGWKINQLGLFISNIFLKQPIKKQILMLEVFFAGREITKLQIQETYPSDITEQELIELVKNNDFAISQYSVVERDKNNKIIGRTFLESEKYKQVTKNYIHILNKVIQSNIFSSKTNKYIEIIKRAFSATHLEGYYPNVWEDCDKAYLRHNDEYSLDWYAKEDYLDPFHKRDDINFNLFKKNIFKNILNTMTFIKSDVDYTKRFKGIDKKLFSYFKELGLDVGLKEQDNIWIGNLLIADRRMDYLSADTTPNNPQNGKKMRFNIAKMKVKSQFFYKKYVLLSGNKIIPESSFFLSKLLMVYTHELSHSVGLFNNKILEELKSTYMGHYFLLNNVEEIEKFGITEKEYVKTNILHELIGCSTYQGGEVTDIYALGEMIVIYKTIQQGGMRIEDKKVIIDWRRVRDIMIKNAEEIISLLKDHNLNDDDIKAYINQVGDFYKRGEMADFLKYIKNIDIK